MTAIGHVFHCVDVGNGSSLHPWHIADLSKDGAKLRVDAAVQVPDHFTLLVRGDVIRLLRCRVVWRSASHVGVKFEQSGRTRNRA